MHGRSQAVRLPKAFQLPGTDGRVRRVGNGILLEPIETDVQAWFAKLDRYRDVPFMEEGLEQPPMPDDGDIGFRPGPPPRRNTGDVEHARVRAGHGLEGGGLGPGRGGGRAMLGLAVAGDTTAKTARDPTHHFRVGRIRPQNRLAPTLGRFRITPHPQVSSSGTRHFGAFPRTHSAAHAMRDYFEETGTKASPNWLFTWNTVLDHQRLQEIP